MVLFPILGRSHVRVEKSNNEIAIMQFLRSWTKVPAPVVLGAGHWGLNPYIFTSYIEGMLLSKRLGDPTAKQPRLDPNVSEADLRRAYYVMARILLELTKPTFSNIGALVIDPSSRK